ncbi:8657_t:CDS:2 [Funneliformis geosporum]|nr:8657_t:CDS:2 [Funneliformis geosporum]
MTLSNLFRNLNNLIKSNSLSQNFRKYSSKDSKKLLTTLSAHHTSAKEAIDSLICSSTKEYDICLVFASRTYEPKDIEIIPQYLHSKLKPKFLGGCVVDKIYGNNNNNGHGISLLLGNRKKNDTRFDGFSINIEGSKRHQYKSNSVGRWKNLDDFKDKNGEFSNLFDIKKFQSISSVPNEFDLPEELNRLKNNNISPDLILLASDSEPYQFLESLDHHFPTTKKIGIIGTSTPFLTGRPFSLFHNNSVLSRGIIGVAITDKSFKNQLQVDHPSLNAVGDPLRITSCRGNIILELDGTNPTRLLLNRLQSGDDKRILSKETEFYLGLYDHNDKDNQLNESNLMINKISSGDPVRGNMAVDTTMDLKEGQFVKFFYRKKEFDATLLKNQLEDDVEIKIAMSTLDRDNLDPIAISNLLKNNNKNIFGAIGENGIIIGKGKNVNNGITWVCDIPYSTALLSKYTNVT